MKARELLAVFLKAVGIWCIACGIQMLPSAFQRSHQYDNELDFFYMMLDSYAFPAVMIIAGGWLTMTTDMFVGIAYRNVDDGSNAGYEASRAIPPAELLIVILKAMGAWYFVFGLAGLPGAISFAHMPIAGAPDIYKFVHAFAGPCILIAVGLLLFLATGRLAQIALIGRNSFPDERTRFNLSSSAPRQLLAVIVKAIGVWLVVNGSQKLPSEFLRMWFFVKATEVGLVSKLLSTVGLPIVTIVFGGVLFSATNWFVRLAFAERMPVDEQETGKLPPDAGH